MKVKVNSRLMFILTVVYRLILDRPHLLWLFISDFVIIKYFWSSGSSQNNTSWDSKVKWNFTTSVR